MGLDKDPKRLDLQSAPADWANVIKRILIGDFVPRNSDGEPQDLVGNLGTSSFSWLESYVSALKLRSGSFLATIQAPTLTADYILKLLTGFPADPRTLKLDSAGQLTAEALNYAMSSSCGNFSTNAGTFTAITNLSVSLTTNGGPVRIMVIPDGSGSPSYLSDTTVRTSSFRLDRDSSPISQMECVQEITSETISPVMRFWDQPSAGSHTYTLNARASGTLALPFVRLFAVELF